MAISNMQQPRQMYGLGSFVKKIGKGIKGAVKSVAKIAKSPLGIAALGLGINQFGIPGIGGSKGFLGSLMGKASNLGMGAKIGLGSAFATYLGSKGIQGTEVEEIKRDPAKLSIYLKDYYTKLNPNASDEEVEEFITVNTSEYAVGGRVGLKSGTPKYKINDFAMDEQAARLGIKRYYLKDDEEAGTFDADEVREMIFGDQYAVGGRVGLESGTPKKGLETLSIKDMEKFMIKGPHMIKYDKDGNPIKYPKPKGEPHKYDPDREIPKRLLLRNQSAMGGLQSMPMGQMRMNKAGTIERDYRETGGFVPVGIKEKADDVPAMLSKNEFVMTADAVRGIGNGNIEKGAQRLYDQMKQAEKRVV
jgi:hypothetical protein